MATSNTQLLQIAHFASLTRWSAFNSVFRSIKTRFSLVPLSAILRRVKEPISIKDEVSYKRITVRLYGQGVLKRDEVQGSEIGTKHQFVAHAGQLIISRIDARNGAFGLVPDELEGAIVTNDFWLFEVHNALPRYLILLLSTKRFQKYWQSQSNGTTNRQRVAESEFLHSEIALPSIQNQRRIIKAFNALIKKADASEESARKLLLELNGRIQKYLGISYSSMSLKDLLGSVNFRCLSRWDPLHLSNRVFVKSSYPMVALSKVIKNFRVDDQGKSLRRNIRGEKNENYQYIGMEDIEKDTGKRSRRVVAGSTILSQSVWVPEGYVLYGRLRPYLNKYWENTTKDNNIVCSSEFFVFDTMGIERKYFITILASEIIQRQLPPLYSGTRMPRISDEDFLNLQIPLPPKSIQKAIVAFSSKTKKAIENLRKTAYEARQFAKDRFEASVFEIN